MVQTLHALLCSGSWMSFEKPADTAGTKQSKKEDRNQNDRVNHPTQVLVPALFRKLT